MSLLVENAKKVEKIFKDTLKIYKDLDLVAVAVISTINGLPIFSFSKIENSKVESIVSALAAGAMKTGDFVGQRMGYDVSSTLELVIRGEDGHTLFLKIKPISSAIPEEFTILAAGSDNRQIGTTRRFAIDFGKLIVEQILA